LSKKTKLNALETTDSSSSDGFVSFTFSMWGVRRILTTCFWRYSPKQAYIVQETNAYSTTLLYKLFVKSSGACTLFKVKVVPVLQLSTTSWRRIGAVEV
jgi:hypothetical protein